MTGFVATQHQAASGAIGNNRFFPDIDAADFASVMQIRQQITPERIMNALTLAVLYVNNRLSRLISPNLTLAQLPAEQIGGVSTKVILYKEAVYTWAKSLLLEEWRNYDLTLEGASQAEQAEDSIDNNRRRCIAAISRLLGKTTNQVALI